MNETLKALPVVMLCSAALIYLVVIFVLLFAAKWSDRRD
jgi:ABC-type amino acid transport system permease subunit